MVWYPWPWAIERFAGPYGVYVCPERDNEALSWCPPICRGSVCKVNLAAHERLVIFEVIIFNVFHGPETVSKDVQPVLELEQHIWKPTKWGSWETLSRSLIACVQALLQVLYCFIFGCNWTKLGLDFLLYTPASPFNPWWRKPLAKTRKIKLQHLDTPRCPSYTKTAIFDIWILVVGQITVDFFSWECMYYVCDDVFPETPLVPRQSLAKELTSSSKVISLQRDLHCYVWCPSSWKPTMWFPG